jgi:phage tail-like protein
MPFLAPNRTLELGMDPGGSISLTDYSFHLTVDDMLTGVFYAMSGGDIEIALVTHDVVFESGASTTLITPGATSFAPITLSRGFANYNVLWTWLMLASNGHTVDGRRNGTIEMKGWATQSDVDGGLSSASAVGEWVTKLRWNFYNAWPSKLSSFGSATTSGSVSTVARVSVTLVVESIEYDEV